MVTTYSILIVDDDSEFAHIMCRRFSRKGYAVTWSERCQLALETAYEKRFDVALVDRSLPDGDGFALAQQLKSVLHDLQVIMLSGHDVELLTERQQDLFYCYLTKPCSLKKIEATVEAACGSIAIS